MNVKKILVAVIAGLVIGAAGVLCFRGCGADVCGDGERTDEVRTELDGAIRNQQQSMTLEQQKIQLQNSDLQLKQAEEKYSLLSSQMKNLEKEMLEQQNSLETARKSFEEFEQEEQLKRDKLKREKSVAWMIAGILLCACIAK